MPKSETETLILDEAQLKKNLAQGEEAFRATAERIADTTTIPDGPTPQDTIEYLKNAHVVGKTNRDLARLKPAAKGNPYWEKLDQLENAIALAKANGFETEDWDQAKKMEPEDLSSIEYGIDISGFLTKYLYPEVFKNFVLKKGQSPRGGGRTSYRDITTYDIQSAMNNKLKTLRSFSAANTF